MMLFEMVAMVAVLGLIQVKIICYSDLFVLYVELICSADGKFIQERRSLTLSLHLISFNFLLMNLKTSQLSIIPSKYIVKGLPMKYKPSLHILRKINHCPVAVPTLKYFQNVEFAVRTLKGVFQASESLSGSEVLKSIS